MGMFTEFIFRARLKGKTPVYIIGILIFVLVSSEILTAQDDFRVSPYLQNPAPDAITIIWFSEENSSGLLSYWKQGSETKINASSNPLAAEELTYSTWEDTTYFDEYAPSAPYRHRLKIEDLEPATTYEYTVTQGTKSISSSFRTAPDGNSPIRFIVYADSETEPESTGKFTNWVDPISGSLRSYLIDETSGYQNNLDIIKSRKPDSGYPVRSLTPVFMQYGVDAVFSGHDEMWERSNYQESYYLYRNRTCHLIRWCFCNVRSRQHAVCSNFMVYLCRQ